jgi:NarL family two-component system response regulator LiaR
MIVDDHAIVRNGLSAFINAFNQFELVSEASNGRDAVLLCETTKPDVILMDLIMPLMDGVTATREIKQRHPAAAIIVLTSSLEEQLVADAIAAGAAGYLLKNGGIDEMASAIKAVHCGDPYFSPQVSHLLMKAITERQKPVPGQDLTERESDVLLLITRGYTNRQIAIDLAITPATVKFHVGNILSKLNVSSRTEAVVKALQHNLVSNQKTSICSSY